MPEIHLKITPKGIKLEGKGYTDNECLKDLEAVKKELAEKYGIKIEQTNQELKSEYWLASKQQSAINIKRG